MSTVPASMQEPSIHAHCKTLRIPTIAAQYSRIAEQATRQGPSHIRYLEALLAAEVEERQQRRIAWRLLKPGCPRSRPWKNSISTPPASPLRRYADLQMAAIWNALSPSSSWGKLVPARRI